MPLLPVIDEKKTPPALPEAMWANVFRAPGQFGLEQKKIPQAGAGQAVIRVRLTTICGVDLHIVNGQFQVRGGLTIGHGAVGTVHELGEGVSGYEVGQRVLVGAVTTGGSCESCLGGGMTNCGDRYGAWQLGNTIDGTQAEYALIPDAQSNLAIIPNSLSDEQVILLSEIGSTGFAAAEQAGIWLGDTVAIFAQGPIGLCATIGARLLGAAEIIAIDPDRDRLNTAREFGASKTLEAGPEMADRLMAITGGRGVDAAIETLGTRETIDSALLSLRPGGTLSSVGVYSGHQRLPAESYPAGSKEYTVATELCPGGKERMYRLMKLVDTHRVDLTPLITHVFPLEQIQQAYEVFGSKGKGVLKVVIRVP